MKFALLIALFITTNVFAADICKFEETWEWYEANKAEGIKPVRTAKNFKKFTSVEKHLVHKTVTLQDYLKDLSLGDAVTEFSEGEIEFYNIEGQQMILVHYWPGDNEYGAFFKINKNGSFKLLATVSDSFIECK